MRILSLALLAAVAVFGQTRESLWPEGKVPLSQGSEVADVPALTAWLPAKGKAVGTAVVVCPGGGYGALARDHEGKQIAEWLNERGVAAFVLEYRLGPKYHHPVMLMDAQRAMRLVRSRAEQLGIRPDRIGIWGFSAGGHLAATASTHFDTNTAPADDPTKDVSSRPDFTILVYPVITLTEPYGHVGSRNNLLGKPADPKLVEDLSNEKRVTAQTPPTFLYHTTDDAVSVMNSILYFQALVQNKVPAEFHSYQSGKHGLGLAQQMPILKTWPERLHDWLLQYGVKPRG